MLIGCLETNTTDVSDDKAYYTQNSEISTDQTLGHGGKYWYQISETDEYLTQHENRAGMIDGGVSDYKGSSYDLSEYEAEGATMCDPEFPDSHSAVNAGLSYYEMYASTDDCWDDDCWDEIDTEFDSQGSYREYHEKLAFLAYDN
jgi:hypothetical protein